MKKRLHRYVIHVGRATLHVSRWTLYVATALLILLAITFAVARFTLPMIEKQKPALEKYLSSRSGHMVRFESLHAYWDGLHPGAQVTGLRMYAPDDPQPAIRLGEVRISLALLPLLWGKMDINSLVVVNPSLALERLVDGRFRVSGFDPLHAGDDKQGGKSLDWLFRQNRIVIENGELQWFDRREMGAAAHFSRVNLILQNSGDRHRLSFSARFPPDMCRDCSFTLDITGNPLVSPEWNGDINLRATELDVDALPLIAREKLPSGMHGKFTAQLSSEWVQGRPVSTSGKVRVAGLRMPIQGWDSPLGIRLASGDLIWRVKGAGWRLDVTHPVFGLAGPGWPAGHIRILRQPDESHIQVRHVNIDDILDFATRIKNEIDESGKKESKKTVLAGPQKIWDYLLNSQPAGAADNLDVRILGDWSAPEDFFLDADIDHGTFRPYLKYPGVTGVHGHLSLSRRAGELKLDSANVAVSLPTIFRAPLKARHASGDIKWEKTADHWRIDGDNLRVDSEDARGTGSLAVRIPLDKSVSPYVKLRVDFADGNGAHASRYYPVYRLSPATLAWMEDSFLGGEITQGYLIYDGPIHDFPFRDHTGKFELRGHVQRAIYQFLPGWEPIQQGEVDVAVDNAKTLVTGSGKIGGLDATQIVVQSQETGDGRYVVHVSGKVTGPLSETLHVLRDVKPGASAAGWLAYVPSDLDGSGAGILSLDLNIPLHEKHSIAIDGEYRFLNGMLQFPGLAGTAEGIDGVVRFTETGISEGSLHARLLGGETELTATRNNDQLQIQGAGSVTAQGLAAIVGPKIAPHISGQAEWNGAWRRGKGMGNLYLQADLHGLKVALPPPLDRPKGLADEKLVIHSESTTPDSMRLALNIGRQAHGRLVFARTADGWRMSGGSIGFGGARVALPKDHGLFLSARLDDLDLDRWSPFLGGRSADVPALLTHLSAEVKSFSMFDRKFGKLSFDLFRTRDTWSGTVNGAAVTGNVQFSGRGSAARYELDLAHLILPDKQHKHETGEVDPRRLPAVVLHSKIFQLQDKQLGELGFTATPGPTGWSIDKLTLSRPEMKLAMNGTWLLVNGKPASDFNIDFNSSDMGKTLATIDLPDQMTGGNVSIKSHLSWPLSPANVQIDALNGSIELTAKKGRFLNVKQGAGRLFGLLDISAISRYLTLDFSPVFGKGLIFDRIHGNVSLTRGDAYTQGFSIHGPATQIDVNGRVGLAREDYDLNIEVQPKLSDSLTLATWGIWGPQVAVAVLAVQKIFKKQIAAGTRITYVVKGAWDKPTITKQEKDKDGKTSASPAKPDDRTPLR
ncbi:MAG: YhdP family protein [Sulfuricaulis sp.]